MTVTSAQFKARFTEFSTATDAQVDLVLAEAETRTKASTWGDLQEAGVMYLAAHLLALGPSGMNARKALIDGTTVYNMERKRLAGVVASGFRVTGDPEL